MSVTAWRIVKTKHADTAFSGEGARLHGGRWNHKGIPVVYLAEDIELAVAEVRVHLDPPGVMLGYTVFEVTIPDDLIETISFEQLPENWDGRPVPDHVQTFGSSWAESLLSCVLRVPSAVDQAKFNFLANPLHPQFNQILIGLPTPLS